MIITNGNFSQLAAICLTFCLSVASLYANERLGDDCESKKPQQPDHLFRSAYDAAHAGGQEALSLSYKTPIDSKGNYFEYGGNICVYEKEGCIWYTYTKPPNKGIDSSTRAASSGAYVCGSAPPCSSFGPGWRYSGCYHSHPEGGDFSKTDVEVFHSFDVWMTRMTKNKIIGKNNRTAPQTKGLRNGEVIK